jgi:hypothetical protein
MRRLLFILVALAARALSLNQAVAQQDQQQTSNGEKEVTGIVTEADEETREITVNDQTFVMPEGGGAALFPQAGDEITLFYRQEGNQKVITRIGQKKQ